MAAKSPRLSRRSVNLRSEGGVVFEPPAPLPETETFVFPDGSKYCGEFKVTENQPVVREGTGIMHFSNGSVYEGEWQGDKMHGKGKLTYANGSSYDGQFENGQYCGDGTLTFSDGSMCQARFLNDKPQGPSRMVDANGHSWVAVWDADTAQFQPCL